MTENLPAIADKAHRAIIVRCCLKLSDGSEGDLLEEAKGIGIQLRTINNALRRYFDGSSEVLKKLENLTCSNKWIMGYLFEAEEEGRDVFQRDFENSFGITRSTVSKMLSLLEKKELIRRESVSHDARLKKISLTEKSREFARVMRLEVNEAEEILKSGFSESELEQLRVYFERIQLNLDNAERKRRGVEKRGDTNDKNAC
ncbi:MAG: MarR family transcriptional regulator [Oscillospiraceae bacterium]|nr:MarR family transcriptional regulator [Oscillospiraceae bacterium]